MPHRRNIVNIKDYTWSDTTEETLWLFICLECCSFGQTKELKPINNYIFIKFLNSINN